MDNFNKNLIMVDNNDKIIGTMKALTGHYKDHLSLHRAFSLFLVDDDHRLVIQQRSSDKLVFPSMWANTVCSHPFLNELSFSDPITDAKNHLLKRMEHELGITEITADELKYYGRVLYKATNDESFGYMMDGDPCPQKYVEFKCDENQPDIIKKSENFYEWEVDYIFVCKKNVSIKPNREEVRNVKSVSEAEFNEMVKNGEVSEWARIITEKSDIFKKIKSL